MFFKTKTKNETFICTKFHLFLRKISKDQQKPNIIIYIKLLVKSIIFWFSFKSSESDFKNLFKSFINLRNLLHRIPRTPHILLHHLHYLHFLLKALLKLTRLLWILNVQLPIEKSNQPKQEALNFFCLSCLILDLNDVFTKCFFSWRSHIACKSNQINMLDFYKVISSQFF